jgi:hypothetical protein
MPDCAELYEQELGIDPHDTPAPLTAVRRDITAAYHGDRAAKGRVAA